MRHQHETFLYRIRPMRREMLAEGPTDHETAIIEDHFNYLKGLHERGVVLLAGRTLTADPSGLGIVILRADSEASAREIMASDPAVKHGVMTAQLFPFRIALM